MSRTRCIQMATLTVFFAVSWAAHRSMAGPRIDPGEWKYTMQTKVEGLGIPVPVVPITFKNCVTTSDASPIETPEMKKAGCKIIDAKTQGNVVTYTARCAHGSSIADTHYKMTFHANSLEGSFDQVRTVNGKVRSTATGTLVGERIGPCTK